MERLDLKNIEKMLVSNSDEYLKIFFSGARLRVCRLETKFKFKQEDGQDTELHAYGEGPDLATALTICNDNVEDGLSYEEQFTNKDAKYPHYYYGGSSGVGVGRMIGMGAWIVKYSTAKQFYTYHEYDPSKYQFTGQTLSDCLISAIKYFEENEE